MIATFPESHDGQNRVETNTVSKERGPAHDVPFWVQFDRSKGWSPARQRFFDGSCYRPVPIVDVPSDCPLPVVTLTVFHV